MIVWRESVREGGRVGGREGERVGRRESWSEGELVGGRESIYKVVICKEAVMIQVNSARSFLSNLHLVCYAQSASASLLLHYCGVSKISRLLCFIPPSLVSPTAKEYDLKVISTFEEIISCKLSVQQKSQLSLGIKQGGWGLTQSSSIACCAFLGAWASRLHHLPERDERVFLICDSLLSSVEANDTSIILPIASHL